MFSGLRLYQNGQCFYKHYISRSETCAQASRYRGGGVVTPPSNSNVGQSWSKWNWYLLKVGQNGTDICLKLNVTVGKFVVKNWQALLILVENVLNMLMLVRKIF
jgi:hypothetical protein